MRPDLTTKSEFFSWRGLTIYQHEEVLKVGTDAVLLGSWIRDVVVGATSILDAGTGTGILAMMYTYGQTPAISLLVIKVEGNFFKKATGITTFTCDDGLSFQQAIREAAASGKSTTVDARSIGKDDSGDIVAEFVITWSFKAKAN